MTFVFGSCIYRICKLQFHASWLLMHWCLRVDSNWRLCSSASARALLRADLRCRSRFQCIHECSVYARAACNTLRNLFPLFYFQLVWVVGVGLSSNNYFKLINREMKLETFIKCASFSISLIVTDFQFIRCFSRNCKEPVGNSTDTLFKSQFTIK